MFKYILAQKTSLPSVFLMRLTLVSEKQLINGKPYGQRIENYGSYLYNSSSASCCKGSVQLLVSKLETSEKVQTNIKELLAEERILN